jgi:hypothetical protein
MSVQFRPAKMADAPVMIGISGPSSSGKTFSALRLATGLAQGGVIVGIDTESKRMLHYANKFDFQYAELEPPFRPDAYKEVMQAAKALKPAVIIVDSMSHEHEGQGGILEWHDEELHRMAGDDYRKQDRMKFTAWIKPKASHNAFVNEVLRMGVHVIFCFRAKDKLMMVKNSSGKMEPVSAGWTPICSDRFEYEMTSLLMLPPNSEGRIDTSIASTKIQLDHKGIFTNGNQIDEEMGAKLAVWAKGDTSPSEAPEPDSGDDAPTDHVDDAYKAAADGTDALETWWKAAGTKTQNLLKNALPELKEAAARVDADKEKA